MFTLREVRNSQFIRKKYGREENVYMFYNQNDAGLTEAIPHVLWKNCIQPRALAPVQDFWADIGL